MKRKSLFLFLLLALCMPLMAQAQKTLPYEYGFENNDLAGEGWTLQQCSTNTGINADAKQTGSYGFRFYYNSNPPQYLISPELTGCPYGVEMDFYYKASSYQQGETFQLGYSTSSTNVEDFVFGETIEPSTTNWTLLSESFPAGTKYVAVKYTANDQYYLYLDDFSFTALPSCPTPKDLTATLTEGNGTIATLSWTEKGSATNWVLHCGTDANFNSGFYTEYAVSETPTEQLTGLAPETMYYARVKSDCGGGDQSGWSEVCSFKPSNAISMIVNDGTASNYNVPLCQPYGDGSQFIIPASGLSAMAYGQITKLSFYAASTSAFPWTTASYDVYLMETQDSYYSGNVKYPYASMSKVYTGTLSVSDGLMTIDFDTPYYYEGDNLVVSIEDDNSSSTYGNFYWYGVTTTNNQALSGMAGNTLVKFLPKMKIAYLEGVAPTHPRPKYFETTNITSTSATFTWTNGGTETAWQIAYTDDADTPPDDIPAANIIDVTTKPYTLAGLDSGTEYYAYIRAVAGNEHSDWSNACTFEVGCFTPTIGESMATCNQAYFSWSPVGSETSWQVVFSDQPGFDPDAVTPETVTTQYYVLEDLTTGVTYYARVRAVCGEGDYSEWSEMVSMTTECFAPSNLQESSVTPTTATLTWNMGSSETQWQISYSTTADFTPENGTIMTVSSKPYTLTGLTLNTQYYAYVRAVCGENIYSDWSNICAFMPKYELTVGNGNNYNANIPIYTYSIEYTSKSQFIVPAAEMTDLLYANISKMAFYASSETGSMGTATFDVLISELDGVTVFANNEFFDWSEMTTVYSGSLSVSGSKMEVILAAPYQYMGGDLLIGFMETASGSTSNYFGWHGAETTGYCAYGGFEMTASSYTDYSRYQFMPKTTFSYTPGTAPTCLKPKNLASSNVGATSAILSWTNGGEESAWVLQYATDADFTQNVVSTNVTTNPYSLSGLIPETTYFARVKADCGDDDFSAWSNVCSFTPSAIQTVVVNNGTGTGYYAPFYGSNTNSANVKSQFVVSSSELTDVVDQHITQLTFHTDTYYSSASFPDGVFKVYLAPTTLTEFTSATPVDWTTLTEVYSGSLSISNNQMEVVLSAPYHYTGGNLLVAFDETTMSSAGAFVSWLGVTTENYPALSYTSTYYYRRQFLPKMTVTYNTAMAVCSAPSNLTVDATSNSATLTWTAGNEETDWNVQYKVASASDWSEVIAVENTPTCIINGLSASTEYDVRIQANCGSSLSPWLTDSFTTECGAVNIPYSYDFSDDATGATAAFPQCWMRINDSESSDYNYYPYVVGNGKVLRFIASSNANAPTTQIAVMPEMDAEINTLRIRFRAYLNTGSDKPLTIGVMTDPNDATTFTKVCDVNVRGTGTSVYYPISLEGYNGTGRYIAFKCDKLASGSDYSIYIDDIMVEAVPTYASMPIPYSCGFEDAETGYNAFPPADYHFSNGLYPYIYESTSLANEGSNFLLMQKPSTQSSCYAVLPPVNTNEHPINTLKLTFWARMWNSTYYSMYLSIGVMTDPNDIDTYQLITSVNVRNSYTMHEIYFDDYVDEGQYIVLRCYNTDNYYCIDDIEVSVAPTCRQPLELSSNYTSVHEANIRWKTRDLRQCNYQVSYSTTESFNPDDGTIVDVEFENTLVNAGTPYRDYELTCLNANTTYYFYVRANCGNGDYSEWSDDYASFTTGEACPAPGGFGTYTVKNTYAEFRWYGDMESEWEFQYKKTTEDEWHMPAEMELLNGEGNEIIFRLSGLDSGTEYEAQLREHCGMYSCPAVDDGYSDWATDTFETSTGCSQPQTWMCLTQLGTSAKLEWYQTGEERQWQIRYRLSTENDYPEGNIVLTDEMDEAAKQRWTVTGLQTNSMYYWQVRAYCDSESQSDWSDENYFFTGGEKITVDKAHPFYEDFEGVDDMPDGFMNCNQYNYDLDHFYSWSFTLAEEPAWDERPGNHAIYNNCDDFHGSTSVILPEMHIDENAQAVKLSFNDYCDYGPSAISGQNISYGSMEVMISTNHGETYNYDWWSFGPKRYWHQHFIDLDEYIGQDIIIRFDYWYANTKPNFDWYVDDVKVQVFDNSFGSGSGVTEGSWDDESLWGNGTPDGDDDVIINANVTIPDGVVAEANQIVINTDTIQTGSRADKFGKLIIANGGQLVTNNEVEATVRKTIGAYTRGGDGWYLIASPVQETLTPDGDSVANVVTDESIYDLYGFDGSQQGEEWRNFKQHSDDFRFRNGAGYLYANSTQVEPEFVGTVRAVGQQSVRLDYASTTFGGWNLVGNPFPCTAYLADNRSFYRMNDTRTALTTASGAIAPMEGVFVEATGENQSVVFTTTAPVTSNGKGSLNISLSKNELSTRGGLSTELDRATLRFDEGQNLGKFTLMSSPDQLYIPQNGKDYAVVHVEPVGEIPLNFKADENGTYTLSVSGVFRSPFSVLRLIDNKTGADIDLLATPSYTFEGHISDYVSRFKLVFAMEGAFENGDFAFIHNGEIIINGEGLVQVFDVLGHQLYSHEANSAFRISHSAFSSGVYVLRLINGDEVRTQKIIIE